jgi:formate dehydrogenase subunit gamma
MSDPTIKAWSEQQAQAAAKRLGSLLPRILEEEVPGELTADQRRRLEIHLTESFAEEGRDAVRRQVRRFLEEERRLEKQAAKAKRKHAMAEDMVERLSLQMRVQHMVMFSSCILLIVTGLPIKFHDAALAAAVMNLFGGPDVTRILHRIGAIGLTAVGIYHVFYCMYFEAGRRDFALLIPRLQDAKDAIHQILYFLGVRKTKPLFGRFSYIEKFDYWAVYWGMVVMITSGYIMWFKDAAINQFGKVVYDIGREAHSDEALLATLAIVVWHFYNVHFNPHRFPGSLTWWHGKISMKDFREEHTLEYEEWLKTHGKPAQADEAGAGRTEVRP